MEETHNRRSLATSKARMMNRIAEDSLSGGHDDFAAQQAVAAARLAATATFASPRERISLEEDASRLRRRSPLSPLNGGSDNRQHEKEKETPRIWKEKSSAQENVARRSKSRVSFSPPPKQKQLSYFSVQSHLDRHDLESTPLSSSMMRDETSITSSSEDMPDVRDDDASAQEDEEEEEFYHAPTHLHQVCYNAKSATDLHNAKLFFLNSSSGSRDCATAASRKDDKGRLPLHVLSENTALPDALVTPEESSSDIWDNIPELQQSSSLFGQHQQQDASSSTAADQVVIKFVLEMLLAANPSGMMWRDGDGYIPFERSLMEWINDMHEDKKESSSYLGRRMSSFSRRSGIGSVWMSKSMGTAITWAGRSLKRGGSFQSFDDDDDEEENGDSSNSQEEGEDSIMEDVPLEENDARRDRNFDKHYKTEGRPRSFPSHVRLTPHVRLALKLLSAILDQLDESNLSRSFRRKSLIRQRGQHNQDNRASFDSMDRAMDNLREYCKEKNCREISDAVINSIASIPDLVKTILLLEDDVEWNWVFSCSITRRVIMNKHSIGPWLTSMLQSSDRRVSHRAVDYLHLLSEASEQDMELCKSTSNMNIAKRNSEELHEEICNLEGLIPSMLAMDEKAIEEAATTSIVKRVLDKMISRPFAVSVVFFDALFLTNLIITFRASVVGFLNGWKPETVLKFIYLANASIFYFIIRELGKGISLCMITRRTRIYFFSFWNVSDVLAIVLALCSTVAMRVNFSHEYQDLDDLRGLRGCLAVTTGLLWLRVLSLLKTINMQLATFVLAIVQITRDILWFLLILLTLVVSFAQMFYTLLIPASCASKDTAADDAQCSPGEYYLGVYSILLGDFGQFEREDFTTVFSVILIVFFSFMVVIVLLNVLIAIVSDSYEKCLVRSQNLFGRARVMLLAELVSFQNLFRKNRGEAHQQQDGPTGIYSQWWSGSWNKGWSRGSALFFFLSALVLLGWIIGETAGYFSGERYGNFAFSFFSILVNVCLFVAIVIFLSRSAPSSSDEASLTKREEKHVQSNKFIRCISKFYEQFIQNAMRRLLGSSSEETRFSPFWKKNHHRETPADEQWKGRVHHLQREMKKLAEESAANATNHAQAIEQHVSLSESRIRGEMNALETKMADFKLEIMQELKESEQRTDEMIRHGMNELLRTLTASRSMR